MSGVYHAVRVAVVGGGIGGCACAWRLLQSSAVEASPVAVTLFEMGRSAGGRASTRRPRDVPGLAVNHGCPLFHAPKPADAGSGASASGLLSSLIASGFVTEWSGSAGRIDAAGIATIGGAASRGELAGAGLARFAGTPDMASIAEGSLKLAGAAARHPSSLRTCFGVKVAAVKPTEFESGAKGWELFDKERNSIGSFDWIVLTSSAMSHPRHKSLFGEEPPMVVAARERGCPMLSEAVKRIGSLQFAGVHVAMLAWALKGVEEECAARDALSQLPFDITEVIGDEVLAKIIRHSSKDMSIPSQHPSFATLVLHSTASFAAQHAEVFGSSSTVSQYASASGSSGREASVADALQSALHRVLADRLNVRTLPEPSWGPTLHRWGGAFPAKDAAADANPVDCSALAWVLPEAKVAFAGDHVAEPLGTLYGAMASGVDAASGILDLTCGRD